MKLLRSYSFRIFFTVLAGASFLNLSFILAEMRIFDLAKDHPLYVSLSNLGEEEQGCEGGETSSEESTKEVDLNIEQLNFHQRLASEISILQGKRLEKQALAAGHRKRFSPPPEDG